MREHLAALEARVGRKLGDPSDPLLVSVRSGAPVSMPGMMDTILNLGLNDRSVEGLARRSQNERFALDSYRRFVQMFGDVVMGVDGHLFEEALDRAKVERGVRSDVDLDAADLRRLLERFRGIYRGGTGEDFPQDPAEQLDRAVAAVFGSWNTPRAAVYRRHEGIADDLGTAVNVVQMVFGNLGPTSGTGVAFTRNPSTGARELYGEFLVDAQGEDVVAGIRTPRPLSELEEVSPEAFARLVDTMQRLESHYRDMQDVEFTIEQGALFILQTRAGKRTAQAAVRVARELVAEGVLDRRDAIGRIDPDQLDQLLHPGIDPGADYEVLATGLNASPGAAVGKAVFDADTAEARGRAGEAVILVRFETTPDDVHGVIAAQAVVTAHGGMTSHAAVVARGMGKPCVCGVESMQIDPAARSFTVNGITISEGDEISVDGGRGLVIRGAVELVPPQANEDFQTITAWADEIRRLGVRANADTPEDAARAREFGAEGIGLCRTEHMFFGDERLPVMREMIMASDEAGRRSALDRLLPFQQSDFEGILKAMAGHPVTIRLLDPPLHEFLPSLEELGPGQERIAARVKALREVNPMLGTRGCRLGILYPEIYEMQVRAIVRAARAVEGARVEIMHPLIVFAEELRRLRALTESSHRGGGRDRPSDPHRQHGRGAAGSAAGRPHRAALRLLLVRHQRPHPDRSRLLSRRCRGQVPDRVPRGRRPVPKPVRDHGRRGAGAGRDRGRAGPRGAPRHQARHLRRARRRSRLDRVLPRRGPRLRLVLALPGADRAAGRRPGGAERGMKIDVAFTPGEPPEAAVAIVIDVLRATTTIAHALGQGYERVLACAGLDRARELHGRLGNGTVLAGERACVRPEGFDLGNSPREFAEGAPLGQTLILTTTNGTRAVVTAAGRADVVMVGQPRQSDRLRGRRGPQRAQGEGRRARAVRGRRWRVRDRRRLHRRALRGRAAGVAGGVGGDRRRPGCRGHRGRVSLGNRGPGGVA